MLSRFSVKKPYTVIVGIVLVIILGIVSLSKMSTDLLPSMNLPYAIVVTSYAGASPEQVESAVTQPIEAAMASTSNIKNISSRSSNNMSMVILEFEQTANMDSVTVEMRESLDQISGYWPDTVGNPIIMKLNPDMLPIMIAAVEVEGMDDIEICDYTEKDLIPEIESVEGVASVTGTGLIEESVQVTLSQKKIDEINEKIKASLDEKFADAESEMDSAQDEISSGKNELTNGRDSMANQISDAQNQLNDKKIELFQTEMDLNNKLEELKNTKSETESGIKSLTELQTQVKALITSKEQLTKAIAELKAMLQAASQPGADVPQVNPGQANPDQSNPDQTNPGQMTPAQMQEQLAQAQAKLTQLEAQLAQVEGGLSQIKSQLASQEGSTLKADASDKQLASYIAGSITKAEQGLVQINGGIAAIESGLESVAQGKTTINDTLATLNQSQISGSVEMGSASAQLASGEEKLKEARDTFEDTKQEAYDSSDLNNILTMETLTNILTAQNFSMPAGYITDEGETYMVRVGDAVDSIETLKDMVLMDLGMDGVDTIHLSDVADVAVTDNSKDSYARLNGKPGVMLSIEKQTGYSTGDVTDRVYEKFESMKKNDENLRVSVMMDQGIYIDMIVDSVVNNMIVGAVLAILILILFLKDIKPTLVIACSIPVSVIFAVVLMYFSGVTLNMISLSGLALGIGMLVDNSIVVIENVYRMRGEGLSAKKAAVEGAKQVGGAITASTLTTVCVFAPIVFVEGITRQLFVDMGLTIAYTLLASLVIALTFVPMMGSRMLRKTKDIRHPWFDKIQNVYGAILGRLLKVKPLVLLVMVALLIASVGASLSRGTEFMPDMESTQMTVTVTPPEDAEFSEACELADEVTEQVMGISDVESVGAMAGEGLTVQIRGRDLDKLQSMASDVKEIISRIEGTTDVATNAEEKEKEFRITVDKEKAAKYGMTVAQIYQIVGERMSDDTSDDTISTDIKDYDIYLESVEQSEATIESLKNITFTHTDKESGEEQEIRLSQVAEFEELESLTSISREGQERYVQVTAAIDKGYNVGLVGDKVQKAVRDYELPEGYSVEMTGEDESINEAMEQLVLMLILAIAFIYLIMVAQFQSLRAPFIILFTVPLAMTGGFGALLITGNVLSIISMIGFVMLVGIIVNNGIVMVEYINQLRKEGVEKREAIITAGKTRLRPILMTALTTIFAMSTMAFGSDMGSDMGRPMAIVTIGGMIYGTLMTLVVVPCIYDLFYSNKSMVEEEI